MVELRPLMHKLAWAVTVPRPKNVGNIIHTNYFGQPVSTDHWRGQVEPQQNRQAGFPHSDALDPPSLAFLLPITSNLFPLSFVPHQGQIERSGRCRQRGPAPARQVEKSPRRKEHGVSKWCAVVRENQALLVGTTGTQVSQSPGHKIEGCKMFTSGHEEVSGISKTTRIRSSGPSEICQRCDNIGSNNIFAYFENLHCCL